MADAAALGPLIRNLRTRRGLRLEDVAKRSGYTKGFLSKIENGRASPPIATLMRLAEALNVDPTVFFHANGNGSNGAGADPHATVHITPDRRTKVLNAGAGPGYTYWSLAAQRTHKAMEPFLLTVHPGEFDPKKTFQHPGEEFLYVLEGAMDYRVGSETFSLGPGDSLYFDSTRPHAPHPKGGPVTFLAMFYAPPRPEAPAKRRAPRAKARKK
ncbi:MAG: helix-turn-helix transcriptional regulator [Planctomycetota bacterium]|nr:helix-turn-helix transcriptional regulator [Planctomycetota bacterium]